MTNQCDESLLSSADGLDFVGNTDDEDCGVGAAFGVVSSLRFLDGGGFLTTLGGVRFGFFCPTRTADVQLNHILHHTHNSC